jgi:hypothetical protein
MAKYPRKKKGRYGAKITRFENAAGKWDSKAEYNRYLYLKSLADKGTIQDLETKVKFSFDYNGVHIGKFSPDFRYKVGQHTVIEDFKGGFEVSRDFPLRVKLLKAFYGLEVVIVKSETEIKHIEELR